MNALLIPYCFAPVQVPQTFVLLKWCKFLAEAGHGLTVLSVDPDTQSAAEDPGLDRLTPRGLHEVRVRSLEKTLPYRVLRKARRWLPSLFQPYKREWFRPARKALDALPLGGFDVVLSSSQPPVCHLLGHYVKTTAGVPWVAYFSDPWVDGPYRQDIPRKDRKYNEDWERKVVCSADVLVFPTEEMKSLVLRKYPQEILEKARTLDHCYVPAWFDLAARPAKAGAARRFVHTGNFYGPRTVDHFLRAIAKCRDRLAGRMVFDFFGDIGPSVLDSPLWRSLNGFVKAHGQVDYLTSLAACRGADALVLIDAPVDPGATSVFFPSKLAEYLGAGRPIIALTPNKGSSSRILRETKNIALDPEDSDGLADLLTGVARGQRSLAVDSASCAKYDYRQVGQQLVAILNEACGS